ncbi:MAG: hypothetical protein DYG98_04365 [Haliscomenobacteraceae bacterium CHB4]|nr:hypothetical protein [Saprospiraceae bacterium]MCE7922266.1 hypothetical protein [Haliscomenobacteraceae bacterium CHB4]
MNLCVRIAFISLWLLLTFSLSAQIGLSLPVVNNINPDDYVNFQVKVKGFDSIVGMQYVIRWDPEVFEFHSVGSYNLEQLDGEDFGTTQALDSGIVRLLWSHSNLLGGISVDSGTAIFRVRLKAIGPVGSGSAILFTQDNITPFDIAQANSDSSLTSYTINQVELKQGFGAIGYTVSADEPSDAGDIALNAFPNAFSEKTTVRFDLRTASDVELSVADMAGHILYKKMMPQLPPGQHGTEIASPQLREKGICFLILRAGTHIYTRSLFVN